MATKREAILSRLVTQLSGTTGCGSRIYRSRVTAINNRSGNSLVIEPISDTCDLTVNNNALDVQCQSTDFEMVDADQPTAVVSTNFAIKYRTDVDSISA